MFWIDRLFIQRSNLNKDGVASIGFYLLWSCDKYMRVFWFGMSLFLPVYSTWFLRQMTIRQVSTNLASEDIRMIILNYRIFNFLIAITSPVCLCVCKYSGHTHAVRVKTRDSEDQNTFNSKSSLLKCIKWL